MRRSLGSFETALTLSGDHSPFVVVLVLQLDGGPSPGGLRRALDTLQARHPPLAARIVGSAGRYRYEPAGTGPIPLEVRPREGDDAWRGVAEEELGRPLERKAGPLVRCLYLVPETDGSRSRGRSEIVLTFHHAIMDAASGVTLVEELLRLGGAGSPPVGIVAVPALPPVETLFPRRFRGLRGAARRAAFLGRQLRDEVSFRLRSRGRRTPPIVSPARCRLQTLDLTRDETTALVRRGRREGATITAALHAALLLAVHRHLYGGRPGPLRYLAFADLRPHLSPPLDATALGSCIAMLRYTADLDGAAGSEAGNDLDRGAFWSLACRVGRQVDAGVRRGDRFGAVALSAAMMRGILSGRMGRMAATALSYVGPVRLRSDLDDAGAPFRVRGLRSYVSNLAEGPEYTAQARLWNGGLQLDVVYLEADMDERRAAKIAAEVVSTLRAAGEEGP